MNSTNENIDKLAQSFFLVLIFCSLLSDSYIIFENFIKNDHVRKRINYFKKLSKVVVGLSFSNYKKDNEGNIIIENENKNNISDDSDDEVEVEQISEELVNLMKEYSDENSTELNKNPFDEDEKDDNILNEDVHVVNEEVHVVNEEVHSEQTHIVNEEVYSEQTHEDNEEVHSEQTNEVNEEKHVVNENEVNEETSNQEELIYNTPIEIQNINIEDVSIKKKDKIKVKKEIKETIIKKNNNKLNENILNKKTKSSKINQS